LLIEKKMPYEEVHFQRMEDEEQEKIKKGKKI
jgi:hypothetical protein